MWFAYSEFVVLSHSTTVNSRVVFSLAELKNKGQQHNQKRTECKKKHQDFIRIFHAVTSLLL